MRTLFYIAAIGITLAACETVVEVDPPPHEPQLVAHGIFTADSGWAVRVTSTVPYTSTEAPSVVADAAVEVSDDQGRILHLTSSAPGIYTGVGWSAVAGRAYRLSVRADGYEPTEGTGRLPDAVHVADFRQHVSVGENGLRVVDLTLALDDPSGIPNYYGLFVVQSRWQIDLTDGTVSTLRPMLFTFESDDDVLEETTLGVLDRGEKRYRDAIFDDERFDGQRREIDFSIRYVAPDATADRMVLRTFSVLAVAASEDLFRYWRTAGRQHVSGENPFAEPVRVHSNMSNGFGVFAGFRHRVLPLPPDADAYRSVCDGLTWPIPPCTAAAGANRRDVVFTLISGFLGESITH